MTEKRNPRAGATATGAEGERDEAFIANYTPPATARPQVGDVVHVHGVGRAHVIAADDPSLLTCQTAQGATFKVGEKSVERLEVAR